MPQALPPQAVVAVQVARLAMDEAQALDSRRLHLPVSARVEVPGLPGQEAHRMEEDGNQATTEPAV